MITERYGKKVEKYKSKSAKAKHEKREGMKGEIKEKAMERKSKAKVKSRTVAQRG